MPMIVAPLSQLLACFADWIARLVEVRFDLHDVSLDEHDLHQQLGFGRD